MQRRFDCYSIWLSFGLYTYNVYNHFAVPAYFGGTVSLKGGNSSHLDFQLEVAFGHESNVVVATCANDSTAILPPVADCNIDSCNGTDPCIAEIKLKPTIK